MGVPMMVDPLNPFKTEQSGRAALSEVLLQIRDQAGVTNWDDFCDEAMRVGLDLPVKTIENYAPNPRYTKAPNPGLFYAIESWNVARAKANMPAFRFANGELITCTGLMDVLLEKRDVNGNPRED